MEIPGHRSDLRLDNNTGSHFLDYYLLSAFVVGLTQALFIVSLYEFLQNSPQLLGRFKLYPSDLILLPLTGFIVFSILIVKRRYSSPTSNRAFLFLLWLIFSVYGSILGIINHADYLSSDIKNLFIRPFFAPLFFVIGTYVNLDKIMSNFTKFSTVCAIYIGANAFAYFVGKTPLTNVSTSIMPGLALLLPFAILFNKFLLQKTSLWDKAALFICAFGIIGDFWKPKVAALFICIFVTLIIFILGKDEFTIKFKKFFLSLAWMVFIFGIMLIIVYMGGYWERLTTLVDITYFKNNAAIQDCSGNRLEIIRIGLDYWRQKPYFGHGFGQALSGYYRDYFIATYLYRDRFFPHNTTLQVLYQTGLIGFSIVFLTILLWLRKVLITLKTPSLKGNYSYIGIVVFCLTLTMVSFFSEALISDVLGFLFWMCVGLEASYAQKALLFESENSQSLIKLNPV